ncbi:MAG: hypothetical protein GF416_08385 [Candidatus Altiarchaeales archaeon]|nr:hypothetical protein [Candidatus Altiarchaeales archaeon]MBD3417132.1 hypothetical protein [Candidatus Altiarchaeales archaeon]
MSEHKPSTRYVYHTPDDRQIPVDPKQFEGGNRRIDLGPDYGILELRDNVPVRQPITDEFAVKRSVGRGLGCLMAVQGGSGEQKELYTFDLAEDTARICAQARVMEARPTESGVDWKTPSTGHFSAVCGDMLYNLSMVGQQPVFQAFNTSDPSARYRAIDDIGDGEKINVQSGGESVFRFTLTRSGQHYCPYSLDLELPGEPPAGFLFRVNVPYHGQLPSQAYSENNFAAVSKLADEAYLGRRLREKMATPRYFAVDSEGEIINRHGDITDHDRGRASMVVGVTVPADREELRVASVRHTVKGYDISDPLCLPANRAMLEKAVPYLVASAIWDYNGRIDTK